MKYAWKPGAHVNGADAQKVGEALHRLSDSPDGVQPEAVVRAARKKSSPLHPCFEWDDTTAATAYRLGQARHVLSHIVVSVNEEDEPQFVRAFVNIMQDEGRSYLQTMRAMGDAELRTQILQRAFQELEGFRKKYEEFKELAGVFTEFEKAKQAAA